MCLKWSLVWPGRMRKGKCDNINEGKTFLPALGTDVIASVLPVCLGTQFNSGTWRRAARRASCFHTAATTLLLTWPLAEEASNSIKLQEKPQYNSLNKASKKTCLFSIHCLCQFSKCLYAMLALVCFCLLEYFFNRLYVC